MTIKIYTCHHKDFRLLKSDIAEPIHVGKARAQIDLPIIGDNTGDNISQKNPYFSELTATYWIWKNATADFVGLFHYRRFLNFKNQASKCREILPSFLDDYAITKENVAAALADCDIILPKKENLGCNSQYAYYAKKHVAADMDAALAAIEKKYPHMYPTAIDVIKGQPWGYLGNIIIAPKAIFDEYAEWLFDILFEVERQIQADVETRDPYQQRVYGFLSERLTSVFAEYKKQKSALKIKELPCIMPAENDGEWKKYCRRQLKRRILNCFGLGKKAEK